MQSGSFSGFIRSAKDLVSCLTRADCLVYSDSNRYNNFNKYLPLFFNCWVKYAYIILTIGKSDKFYVVS